MSGETVLFSEMIPQPGWEDEFNAWYDSEHIPIRMKVRGFQRATRYREADGNKYLAVYEMDNPDVLKSAAYEKIKNEPSEQTRWMLDNVDGFTRYTANKISEQIGANANGNQGNPFDAPFLYPVFFEVPGEREDDFNRWYVEDHVPILLQNRDWLACRRYRIFSGTPENWTHLALHYLADPAALQSKEREQARNTPWRNKISREPWFKGKYMLFKKMNHFTADM